MKWFDNWFSKKCKQAWDNANKVDAMVMNAHHDSSEKVNRIHNEKTMTLNVTRASGGWIIENRQYDAHKDRTNTSIYIVTDDKDLGEELSKIITYENIYR
jgi:hypothetical protein